MDGIGLLIGGLVVTVGLFCLSQLAVALSRFCLTRFGLETTAFVISAQRYNKDGDLYLQGHYVYQDANAREHIFDFTICSYWPGDAQWQRIIQCYSHGAQTRVRYLPWLPILHEITA